MVSSFSANKTPFQSGCITEVNPARPERIPGRSMITTRVPTGGRAWIWRNSGLMRNRFLAVVSPEPGHEAVVHDEVLSVHTERPTPLDDTGSRDPDADSPLSGG